MDCIKHKLICPTNKKDLDCKIHTFASCFAKLLDFVTMVQKQPYTSSSASLSAKHMKFSCSLAIDFSLYDNMERQNERSRHWRSTLEWIYILIIKKILDLNKHNSTLSVLKLHFLNTTAMQIVRFRKDNIICIWLVFHTPI